MKLPTRIALRAVLGKPFAKWFSSQRKRDRRKASPLEKEAAKLFLGLTFPERFPSYSFTALEHPAEIGNVAKYSRAFLRHLARSKRGRARLALLLYCYHHPTKTDVAPAPNDRILKELWGWMPHKDVGIRLYHDGSFIHGAAEQDDWFETDLETVDVEDVSLWASSMYLKDRYGVTRLNDFGVEDFRNAVKALRTEAPQMFLPVTLG